MNEYAAATTAATCRGRDRDHHDNKRQRQDMKHWQGSRNTCQEELARGRHVRSVVAAGELGVLGGTYEVLGEDALVSRVEEPPRARGVHVGIGQAARQDHADRAAQA